MPDRDTTGEPEGVPSGGPPQPFESAEELQAFFRACDATAGLEREPDWEEHLEVINRSRESGTSGT